MPEFYSNTAETAARGHSAIVAGYIMAIYFTDTGHYDQPDSEATMAPETIAKCAEDCAKFAAENAGLLEQSGLSDESIGHDLWLTRGRHSAGFWDRGLGDIGDSLTQACEPLGSVYAYLGDDGLIYIS